MTALVRFGEPDDWDAAVEVWRLADEARNGRELTDAQVARTRALGSVPASFFVVAADDDGSDGSIVGVSLGMLAREDDGAGPPIPGLLHVAMVYVRPDRWGEGIGAALVDRILDEGWARELSDAQLWTAADNDRAQALYERLGWTRSGREKHNDDGVPIVHYVRAL